MLNKINGVFAHTSDLTCHWCPKSQRYAGGDALLTYLNDGWEIQDDIHYEAYWHGGSRRVLIYYFVLVRRGECVTMRVVSNPLVDRLLDKLPVRVLEAQAFRARMRQPQQMVKQLH
jgi:hypothetical protein